MKVSQFMIKIVNLMYSMGKSQRNKFSTWLTDFLRYLVQKVVVDTEY